MILDTSAVVAILRAEPEAARFAGSGHPARLNFRDCFAYALAKHRQESLLFKGNDFRRTDVKIADA